MKPALHIKNLTKKYGEKVAVDDISLEIKKGEFFGFLGPNGAGKTTTINCIVGINTIQNGSINLFGLDVVNDYREARKKVGIAPQEYNVDIFASAENMLHYVGGYYGMKVKERKERMKELFKQLNLTEHANKPFRTLSGGLKRRVMLARALIHNPEMLILDEPTAGVDVELRLELWDHLQRINKEGTTILFTSHYLEEVEKLCNRIAIIDGGKIVAVDEKKAFVKQGSTLEKRYLELTKKK